MIHYVGYDITFQEVPNEISLTIAVAGCAHRCKGCHSPMLQQNVGDDLEKALPSLLNRYADAVTCVCFMGTGTDVGALVRCLEMVRARGLKTAVYSGDTEEEADWLWKLPFDQPDYVKFGPYIEARGGLDSPQTNQRMYRYDAATHHYVDITSMFQKSKNRLDKQILEGSETI